MINKNIIKIIILLAVLAPQATHAQSISVNTSANKSVDVDGVLHMLTGNAVTFNMEVNTPQKDSITIVDQFIYSFNSQVKNVDYKLDKGKITSVTPISSEITKAGTLEFRAGLVYYTGDSIDSGTGKKDWDPRHNRFECSPLKNVQVWNAPEATFVGNTSVSVKSKAQGLKWEVQLKGGYDNGWSVLWEYNGQQYKTNTFELPTFTNMETDTKSVVIKLTVTNKAPDNSTVWYSDSKTITVTVEGSPQLSVKTPSLSGYVGSTVTAAVEVSKNNYSGSEWTYNWTMNGETKVTNVPNCQFTLPTETGDGPWSSKITVKASAKLNGSDLYVINSNQEIALNYYSKGRIVVTTPDSTNVYSGKNVELRVTSYGGVSNGWSFEWFDNGTLLATTTTSSYQFKPITAASSGSESHKYSVKATNKSGSIIGLQTEQTIGEFMVWPACQIPSSILMIDNTRGHDTNVLKIRENNNYILSLEGESGGYYKAGTETWRWQWNVDNNSYNTKTITLTANLKNPAGISMHSENITCNASISNMGAYGKIWDGKVYTNQLTIYKKPGTPLSLVIKGNGTSNTMIATMSLTDDQMESAKYNLVFGYIDAYGVEHVSTPSAQEKGNYRYFTFDTSLSSENRYFVYSQWNYADGAQVTSGRRFIDIAEDDWDGSIFDANESREMLVDFQPINTSHDSGIDDISISDANNGSCEYYDLNGRIMPSGSLIPGIYIKVENVDGKRVVTKSIVK